MSWRRLQSLLVPLLAVLLTLTSILPATAAPLRPTSDEAISLLTSYGMVLGDEHGNLNLTKAITRAEAATIFVRAMGQEGSVRLLGNLSSFPDTNGHWAAAYITVAFRLGLMKGRDTGLFDPGAEITNAEVLTVLLRIVKREPAGVWNPANVMLKADELGLVNFPDPGAVANQRAIRGDIFQSLAWTITTVPLADEGGKTALAAYVDKTAPKLSLDAVPESTGAASVRLSGTAKGAAYVQVNGKRVNLSGEAFSTDLQLVFGSTTFSVEAYDWAGNKDSKSITIARAGEAARIVVTGDVAVKAGESGTVNVKGYDASGVEIPTSLLKATVSNNLGTFDPATATFKAGTKAGKGSITFTSGTATAAANVEVLGQATEAYSLSVAGGVLVTQGKSTTVTVKVLDRNGQVVTWDSGRTVTLTSSSTEALWVTSGATAQTNRGVATFTVGALKEGTVNLTATSTGLTTSSASVQIASSTRIVLVPSAVTGGADGLTPITIRAMLQDEAGAYVTNTGIDIAIDVTTSGGNQSNLTNRTLYIRSGSSSSSGGDASLMPGFENESVNITGTVRSGQPYTVLGTRVSFAKREIGTPARLELMGGGTYAPNTPITFTLTVRDSQGNVVPTNSFAFQVQATTDNNEAPVGGMPPGLSVQLGTTGRNPVAAATGSVVGRTVGGFASLTVSYNKSGTVTLKLLPVSGSSGGYDANGSGTFGGALSSLGLFMGDKAATWAGTPNKIAVSADLPQLGLTNQPTAVLAANTSAQARLKVQVLDSTDGKLPAVGTVTLEKVSGTATTMSLTSANVLNGVAEFPINGTTNVGVDEYKLTFWTSPTTSLPSKNIKVATSNAVLGTRPWIVAISGQSGQINRVAATDSYMEIQLPSYGAGVYGAVKVHRASTNSLVYTSPVLELNGFPYIRVPKANLTAGADGYYVTINNGFGDTLGSDRYPALPSTVTVEVLQALNISSVRYNAATSTLTVTAPGVQPGGVIDLSRLSLAYQAPASGIVGWGGATCTANSGYFTCTSVVIPASSNSLALTTTGDAWYRYDPAGTVAQSDSTVADNVIPGLANITSAVLSFTTDANSHVTGRITITGGNLAGVTIFPEFIKIGGESLGLPGQTLVASSSTSLTFDLPNFYNTGSETTSIAAKVAALNGSTASISALSGWARYGSDYGSAVTVGGGVYKSITLSSIQYVAGATPQLLINGTGFLGGTVQAANLKVVDRSNNLVFTLNDPLNTSSINASGTQIAINLIPAQAGALDNPTNNYRFNVFLVSELVSGSTFWFQSADLWYATNLENRLYPVSW